jgi:hypothetical protein
MRINELIGAKNHPAFKAAQNLGSTNDQYEPYSTNEKRSLTSHLKKLGWTLAGSGWYALVYKNPMYNYVLKVFSAKNALWIEYFHYIRQHQDNPHVPQIKGGLVKLSGSAFAVRMEKLTPLKSLKDPIIRQYIDPAIYNSSMDFWDIFRDENNQFLTKNFPALPKLIEDVWEIAKINGDWDLHNEENIMKRGNTIVITDPI